MREIEVKAKLVDKDSFLQAANRFGINFSDSILQKDTTYETVLEHDDPSWNIFRLRKQNGKVILTMKHKASKCPRDNYEYETTVDNVEDTIKILERLDYRLGVSINKQRRIARYNGVELCVDSVEKLGDFVEVEKLVKDDVDAETIQSELWDILSKLGVASSERVYKGYDTLMHELNDKEQSR